MYEIEFDDGNVKEYGATMIAENGLTQVDADGLSTSMKAIVDRMKDNDAIHKEDACVADRLGRQRPRKSTKGRKLQVLWNDGTQSWIDLKFLKESNPVDVVEFAQAHGY